VVPTLLDVRWQRLEAVHCGWLYWRRNRHSKGEVAAGKWLLAFCNLPAASWSFTRTSPSGCGRVNAFTLSLSACLAFWPIATAAEFPSYGEGIYVSNAKSGPTMAPTSSHNHTATSRGLRSERLTSAEIARNFRLLFESSQRSILFQ
jgi:hypothetical protein